MRNVTDELTNSPIKSSLKALGLLVGNMLLLPTGQLCLYQLGLNCRLVAAQARQPENSKTVHTIAYVMSFKRLSPYFSTQPGHFLHQQASFTLTSWRASIGCASPGSSTSTSSWQTRWGLARPSRRSPMWPPSRKTAPPSAPT
jgi:hypothetical protein